MKTICQLLAITVCLLLISFQSVIQLPVEKQVNQYIITEIRALNEELGVMSEAASIKEMQAAYFRSRRHYKHVEFYIEFISPLEAKYSINGPLVPKFDPDRPEHTTYMQGFQRIEELLFGKKATDKAAVMKISRLLISRFSLLLRQYEILPIVPSDILEMQQFQLYRISALNLNGYDATFVRNNVTECEWNLEGMEQVLNCYARVEEKHMAFDTLMRHVEQTKAYLHWHKDYESFERLPFIVSFINPLNAKLVAFHRSCGYGWNRRKQAVYLQAGFLFGKESFSPSFFSRYFADTSRAREKAALGKILFFDPVLSGNNDRSCASCHRTDRSLADGMMFGSRLDSSGHLPRNTPSLWNVMYQQSFFYDGRARDLEQQILHVLHSKEEMNAELDQIVMKLRKSEEYRALFRTAFSGSPDSALTEYAVKKSLAEFEKTLVAMDSRFDRYLKGDREALTLREINGYNLFAGKALCGSCHFFPLFNGTVPPSYMDTEYEIIGVPSSLREDELDSDKGRFNFFRIDHLQNAFKTPGLRNVSLSAPYMHNGVYSTLEQVMNFYTAGGGMGLAFEVPNQTLPFDSLQLTTLEEEDIILFMKALEDTSAKVVAPQHLPVFQNDPLLQRSNQRKSY